VTHGSLARRYAGVLFEIVNPRGGAARALGELNAIRDLVAGHAELQRVFDMPMVPAPKKRSILEAVLAGSAECSDEVKRLMLLLADRDRLSLLPQVAAAFSDRVMQSQNIVAADVVTAVPLTPEGRAALEAALSKAVGSRVEMHERLDPSIIGGVIARVGSVVYDGSVTRQIERLRERLTAEG
jgi:F-type H+-transporting ATPase subunit delta